MNLSLMRNGFTRRQFGLEHSLAFPVDIGGEVNYIFEFFWQEGWQTHLME